MELAGPLVKLGGQLVYVTCSVLPEENGDQLAWLAANHAELAPTPWREAWVAGVGGEPPSSACGDAALLLTPARHGTDGFFVAVLTRAG
jgi:16S rRNA (cytosine967-C5)-methyltransferase